MSLNPSLNPDVYDPDAGNCGPENVCCVPAPGRYMPFSRVSVLKR
jgi:hypothetical protein